MFGVALLFRSQLSQESTGGQNDSDEAAEQVEPVQTTPEPQPIEAEPAAPVYDAAAIQAAVDTWVATQSGSASIVVSDPVSGAILATSNAEQAYFSASIYKLYVAYEGYRAIDSGDLDPTQAYLNGNTLAECLDIMIRESDSPCAEKLWAQLGKQQLTDILATYGLVGTDMTSLSTTASDVAIILERIAVGEGLRADSQSAMLDSMQNQIFRDALNKGFSANITVYNKIGFREMVEYHDTAIIELPSSERIVIAVFTERVGTTQIAALGAAIEVALTQ